MFYSRLSTVAVAVAVAVRRVAVGSTSPFTFG
jgi:uncharacterized Ntn-hydrolase superfamily protein